MFEKSETIRRKSEKLWAVAARLDRGDVLTNEAIAGVVGVGPHEHPWPTVVAKVRRRLLRERGIACLPEYGVGLRLLTDAEQITDLPAYRHRKSRRQIRHIERALVALDGAALTPHLRRLRQAQLEAARTARRQASEALRVEAMLARRPEGAPRVAGGVPAVEVG
jgi:hypothetical protein